MALGLEALASKTEIKQLALLLVLINKHSKLTSQTRSKSIIIVIFQKVVSCSQAVQATYSAPPSVCRLEKSSSGVTVSCK